MIFNICINIIIDLAEAFCISEIQKASVNISEKIVESS